MKQRPLLLVVACFLFTTLLASEASRSPAQSTLYDFPLTFEENRGQANDRFDYVARGPGYGLYLSGGETLFGLRRGSGPEASVKVLRMRLAGGLAAPSVRPLQAVATKSHYYLGNDPAKWLTDIPHYERILYSEVYPGVDLVFYGTPGHLEYDFIVAPGASWEQIRLQFEGVDDLSISPQGHLVLKLKNGQIVQPPPAIYQESQEGERLPISGSYVLADSREVAFRVGSFDPALPLVIDPIVIYLGYLGGSSLMDDPRGIATDSSGAAYVTGETLSSDFPATLGSPSGGSDAYVAKINAQGTAIEWAAFFGGTSGDRGNSIAVDASLQVYFCDATRSSDLPTASAYQGLRDGDEDAFVAMLSSSGASLLYSSYLGGTTAPEVFLSACNGIDVDSGLIYVGGVTNTSDFDTTLGAFDTTGPSGFSKSGFFDGDDAFISVFDPSLSGASSLVYSTYLGGEQGGDVIYDLAVIAPGQVVVTGGTSVDALSEPGSLAPAGGSTPFPTTVDAFQTSFQGGFSDAFVTRLDTTAIAAAALVYSTFFGSTTNRDEGHAIDVLGDDAFILGKTSASGLGFPTTPGAYQTSNNGGSEVFIARFDTSGTGSPGPSIAPQGFPSTLIFSTLYGGSFDELPDLLGESPATRGGIAVNSLGEAWILGDSLSSDLTLMDAFQAISNTDGDGSPDLFVARIDSTGTELDFASYLGGTNDEFATGGVALAPGGMVIAALSASSGLATPGSFDETLELEVKSAFGQDGIVAWIGEEPADLDLTVSDSPDPVLAGNSVTYSITAQNLGTAAAENATLSLELNQSSFLSATVVPCNEDLGVVTCELGTMPAGGGLGPAPAGSSILSFDMTVEVDALFTPPGCMNNSLILFPDVPFTEVFYISKANADGDRLVVGAMSPQTLDLVPLPGALNQMFCDPVELAAGLVVRAYVPTAPERSGDFSDFAEELIDPLTNEPFPGGIIPGNRLGEIHAWRIRNQGTASTLSHTFLLSSDRFDPDLLNNSVTEDTTVSFETDLEVTKTDSDDPVGEEDGYSYEVTITNNGPSVAWNVSLIDTIPLEILFDSSDPDDSEEICFFEDPQLSCFFGNLDPGESRVVTIQVTAGPGPATATNTATVSSETADSNPGNNSTDETTTILGRPDLTVEVTDVPDPVAAGTSLTYNVSVGNAGTRESTNTLLDVTLDPGLSLVSTSQPPPVGISIQGTIVCTPNGNSLSCDLGTIAAGSSTSVSIVTAVDPGQTTALFSQFDVSTDLDEQNELNNSATENTDVTALTDLFISKTDSPDPVATDPVGTGEVLTYTITATNLGPTNASGVVVEDTLPEGVIFFSSNPSICALNGSLSCTFGDLAAEQSKQVAVSVGVTALPGTTLSNTAIISGSQDDPNSGNNSATELTSVELTADLAVELTHSPDVPSSGVSHDHPRSLP